jgi:hypothetical protein
MYTEIGVKLAPLCPNSEKANEAVTEGTAVLTGPQTISGQYI